MATPETDRNYMELLSFINQEYLDPSKVHKEHKERMVRNQFDQISVHIEIGKYKYVFSRFNLSRYLMACQIPPHIAVDISREIKKDLATEDKIPIKQEELNQKVFQKVRKMGIEQSSFERTFRIIERFNFEHIPLILFIAGTGFIGKSTTAFLLGERLNISTILQTDLIYAMMNNTGEYLGRDLWYTPHKSVREFMEHYHTICKTVQRGIEGDITKTLSDGKPLIVEGIHLDPDLFLSLCGSNSLIQLNGFNKALFGSECKGKKGFILPILLYQPKEKMRDAIIAAIYDGSYQPDIDPDQITEYAMAIQDELLSKFPQEYKFEVDDSDIIIKIHEFFLSKLRQYYAQNPISSL